MDWWRRRESNPRPKAFRSDLYMRIRVVEGDRAPKGRLPFRLRHRLNPANRGRKAIPGMSLTVRDAPSVKPASSTPFPGPAGTVRKGVA